MIGYILVLYDWVLVSVTSCCEHSVVKSESIGEHFLSVWANISFWRNTELHVFSRWLVGWLVVINSVRLLRFLASAAVRGPQVMRSWCIKRKRFEVFVTVLVSCYCSQQLNHRHVGHFEFWSFDKDLLGYLALVALLTVGQDSNVGLLNDRPWSWQNKVRSKAGDGRRDWYFANGPGLEPSTVVWMCSWLQFSVSIAIRCTSATNRAVPRFINIRIMSFPINVFETLISHFRYV